MDTFQRGAPLTTMPRGCEFEAFYAFSQLKETTEYHCHDFYEFYMHLSGGQYFGLDSNQYLLEPYQFFIIPPFSIHGLSSTSELHNYERLYLNLSPELLKTLGYGVLDMDQLFREYTSRGIYSFRLSAEEAKQCIVWISKLQASASAEDPLEQFGNYALLTNFLNVMCHGIRRSQPIPGTVISNSVIQNVLTYINNHYTQPLRIDQLARQFGVSVSYLSHEFAKFTNRSVYDYILYRRVMLACQMMQTDESLNAIAYQCGFNDYSNFLRMFSKLVGKSPSRFRKDMQRFTVTEPSSGEAR